jgi:para-nitrobenzyl esterase
MPACLRFLRGSIVCLLAVCGALAATPAQAKSDMALAFTDKGIVRGTRTPTMRAFRGIPYAAPPVGELRWRPPEPAERWHGLLDATQFANHCPQPASPFGTPSVTEDCLYLNVYTPAGFPFLRPVMVWFHGGALFLGESDGYDPSRLVEQGVVVVTINYRLGLLGFLAHPELSAESSYGGSGDYGSMDQQAALRWVRRNILLFGGNPLNVTIFGQSAGGLSVHTQLASPEAEGLFQRAIVESGAYALDQPSLADAEAAGMVFASAAGCSDQTASCLRGLDVEELLAVEGSDGFVPNLDGKVLTQTVRQALESGDFNQVPVIEGSTHDEWRLFVGLDELVSGPLTAAGYPGAIASTLGVPPAIANYLAYVKYPLFAYPSPSVALGALGTDVIFACSGRTSIQLLSQYVPTYAYEFDDQNAPQDFLPPLSFPTGAYHASEVQYLFDIEPAIPVPALTEDQQALADQMVKYWTKFACSGDPNRSDTPEWTPYDAATDEYQSLAPPSAGPTSGFAADHMCDFWATAAP